MMHKSFLHYAILHFMTADQAAEKNFGTETQRSREKSQMQTNKWLKRVHK